MKQFLPLLLASSLLVPAAFAAAAFEGKVNFKVSAGSSTSQEMTYSLKGDKMRIDRPGQKEIGGMIYDMTKKEMLMIMPEQRMYMTMPISEAAVQKMEKQADDVTVEKTNEHEKILGYPATKYVATDSKGVTTEMWLAEGLGTYRAMSGDNPMARGRGKSNPGGAAEKGWERALAGKELFPLRVASKDKAGKETYRMEVTGIEKKSLPDADFAPPEGFQKFDMGGMMKGIFQGIGR